MHRGIKITSAGSLLVGKMPKGCSLCVKGAKLVLFVTGLCKRNCYYCPLSEKRKGKDVVYANERPVNSLKEIFEEATAMNSLGAGITGGDPSIKLNRAVGYIKALKKKFGEKYHIHMYACGKLSREELEKLRDAGLDEIRFHDWNAASVKTAADAGLCAGVEIPAVPHEYQKIIKLLKDVEKAGGKFANLNELEFSETNVKNLMKRGLRFKSEDSAGVKGSEETAIRVMRWAAANTRLNVHYCPSRLKDAVQLRNRLKRKAKNVAKPHQRITEDGLLFMGIVTNVPPEALQKVRKRLIRKYEIPGEMIVINWRKKRIEMEWRLAEKIATNEPSLKIAWVEEYPTFDGLETTVIPLSIVSGDIYYVEKS
ncbi:MAG: radical SAM protein [Candidatus Hadarchaeales archaeon]